VFRAELTTIATTHRDGLPTADRACRSDFSLHPVGKLTGCQWRLGLWKAELTGTITTDPRYTRIRPFTHAVDMAVATDRRSASLAIPARLAG